MRWQLRGRDENLSDNISKTVQDRVIVTVAQKPVTLNELEGHFCAELLVLEGSSVWHLILVWDIDA